jgi:hypothetical protein
MPHPESSSTESPADVQPTADHPNTSDHEQVSDQWHAGGGSALAEDDLAKGPRADHPAPDISTEERERKNTPA